MIIYDPKITGSFQVNGSTVTSIGDVDTISGSVAALNAATSSYALSSSISGSFTSLSASLSTRLTDDEGSITSLNAATSSYLQNTTDTLTGDLTVTGTITAQEFHTEYVSGSIIYTSGSTKFGDSYDDVHEFTGSVNVSNSLNGVSGSYTFTGGNFTVEGDDADFNLNITSGSALANLTEFRFQTDGGTMGRLYMHKGTKHMYLGPTYFPTSSLFIQDGTGTVMTVTGSSVGIGTSAPQAELDVRTSSQQAIYAYTDGGYNALEFTSDGGATTGSLLAYNNTVKLGNASNVGGFSNGIVIDSTGNVGIGTGSPETELDIFGPTQDQLRLRTAGSEHYRIGRDSSNGLLYFYGSQTGYTGYVFDGVDGERMRIDSSGDVYINGSTENLLGTGTSDGSDSKSLTLTSATGNSSARGAYVTFYGNEHASLPGQVRLVAGNTTNAELRINAVSSTGFITNYVAGSERMRIDSSGQTRFKSSTDYSVGLVRSGTDEWWLKAYTDGRFALHENGVGDQFTILAGGSVGINSTSPAYKLDVVGNARFTEQVKVDQPIVAWSDSGTKHYTHLATFSGYGAGASALIINTNIPGHNQSGNGNMFTFRIVGYGYGGQGLIDMLVGCYAGENNYYSAYWTGTCQENWIDNVYVYTNSSGKVAFQLGETTDTLVAEIAITDFVQGFGNVNTSYADSWSCQAVTTLPTQTQKTTLSYKRIIPDVQENVAFTHNVGIGTTSHSSPLEVHGQQKWYTTNADGNELRGFFNPGGSADNSTLSLYKADGSTLGLYFDSGQGILFEGGADYLDDYEIGSWTPTYPSYSTGAPSSSSGKYTKTGKRVIASFEISGLSASTGNHYIVIAGLPYAQYQFSHIENGYCNIYPYGNRTMGIVINNSSGNNTQWYAGFNVTSTISSGGNLRGTIIYTTS